EFLKPRQEADGRTRVLLDSRASSEDGPPPLPAPVERRGGPPRAGAPFSGLGFMVPPPDGGHRLPASRRGARPGRGPAAGFRSLWEVTAAANGRVALDRLAEHRPGLILLDLMMPEMDGFEFIEALRARPEWRGIPVVVLTAKELSPEDRRRLTGVV